MFKLNPAVIALYIWVYLGWFACILLGQNELGYYAPVFPIVSWLLFFKARSPVLRDCLKLLFLAIFGILADTLSHRLHIIHFTKVGETGLIPVWMISLWFLFVPSIYMFEKPFGHRLWLAAILGGIMGPLSYKSGERFDVLVFHGPETIAIYAVFWALFMPLAIRWVRPPQP